MLPFGFSGSRWFNVFAHAIYLASINILRRGKRYVNSFGKIDRRVFVRNALLTFCADVQEPATAGSEKATPLGVFDCPRKRQSGAWGVPNERARISKTIFVVIARLRYQKYCVSRQTIKTARDDSHDNIIQEDRYC